MTTEDLDRHILDRVQSDFPLSPRPYKQLAEELGVSQNQLLERLGDMLDSRVIRRIGPVFSPQKLGYQSTLCAAAVEPGRCDQVAEFINGYTEVTHNYLREHRFNVWFTLIARSPDRFDEILSEIGKHEGVHEALLLPATKVYKIKVHFHTSDESNPDTASPPQSRGKVRMGGESQAVSILTEQDIALIRALQSPLRLVERPFDAIAKECGMTVEAALDRTKQWCKDGTIRRFGSRVNHRRIGYSANGMSVWRIDDDRLDEMGEMLSAYPQISHCYARPSSDSWPYNLYGMIHGEKEQEILDLVERISNESRNPEHIVLFSTKEYKKTAPKYFLS